MLNYISAEWYKLRHTKGIFIAFGILLILITMVFVPSYWYRDFEVYATAYIVTLVFGFFLAPIFAVKAFDDQYGRGSLKNEVVFGIPRSRIYLGKLAFGGLLGSGAAFLVLVFYLAMCFAFSGGLREGSALLCVDLCVRGTLIVLPLWLAGMSLAFCLLVVIKSSAGAVAINYLILVFGMPISIIGTEEPTASHIVNFFSQWFFVAPYRNLYQPLDLNLSLFSGMAYSWLVGLGWIAVTSMVGMALFSRREIN